MRTSGHAGTNKFWPPPIAPPRFRSRRFAPLAARAPFPATTIDVCSAASGDVAAAVELLSGAVRAACHSVDSNLAALKDGEYVARVAAERHRLEEQSDTDAAHARRALATA